MLPGKDAFLSPGPGQWGLRSQCHMSRWSSLAEPFLILPTHPQGPQPIHCCYLNFYLVFFPFIMRSPDTEIRRTLQWLLNPSDCHHLHRNQLWPRQHHRVCISPPISCFFCFSSHTSYVICNYFSTLLLKMRAALKHDHNDNIPLKPNRR